MDKTKTRGGKKMAFSTEARVNALKDVVNGQTDQQVSAKHGVSTHTLISWKKLLLTTGSLDKKKVNRKSGTPYKYKPDKLKDQLDKSSSTSLPTAPKESKDSKKAKDTPAAKATSKPKVPKANDKKKKKTTTKKFSM
jgi:hypothetical protein